MVSEQTIIAALRKLLPDTSQTLVQLLAQVLIEALAGKAPQVSDPHLVEVLYKLQGTRLQMPQGDITVGNINGQGIAIGDYATAQTASGTDITQIGSLYIGKTSIGDIVGGDKISITLNIADTSLVGTASVADWPAIEQRWTQWLQAWQDRIRAELEYYEGDSPLDVLWDSFLKQTPWHEVIAELCNRAKALAEQTEQFKNLAGTLSSIDFKTSYGEIETQFNRVQLSKQHEIVLATINQFRKQHSLMPENVQVTLKILGELGWCLDKIGRQLKQPYCRCFLVLGRLGAGKTHFIGQVLSQAKHLSIPTLLLPIARIGRDGNFELALLTQLREATGWNWDSLATFERFILEIRPTARIIVIVDDAHLWASVPGSASDLSRTIEATSKFHNIYWLITADFNFYEQLRHDARFWIQYSGFSKASQTTSGDELGARYKRKTLPIIDGWIDVHQLNQEQSIGEQLLYQHWASEYAYLMDLSKELSAKHDSTRYLALPFIAWLIIDGQLSPEVVLSFNYIDFVSLFWDRRYRRIDYRSMGSQDLSLEAINQDILYPIRLGLAELGAETMSYSFERDQASRRMISLLPEQYKSLANWALDALIQIDLAEEDQIPTTDSLRTPFFQNRRRYYRLRYEAFWDAHIAAHLIKPLFVQFERSVAELESSINKIVEQYGQRGVYEYLLLLADTEADNNPSRLKLLTYLCETLLKSSDRSTAAIWLAGIRGSDVLQQVVLVYARTQELLADYPNEVFAYVYFVAEALTSPQNTSRHRIGADDRIAILRRHFLLISRLGFASYFEYIVRIIIQRVRDTQEIVKALPLLSGCEILDITASLSEILIRGLRQQTRQESALTNLTSKDDSDGLQLFLDHALRYLQPYGAPELNFNATVKSHREFFYEWALFWVCEQVVSEYGVDSYSILYERGWYHDLHGAVNPTFGLLMRKEANLALGNWYFHQRHHHEDDKYVTLVKQLVNSNDVREREVAFYLIRHARPTYRQANVEVDKSFLPLLERLYGDPDLFWRGKDLAMFRYNLGDDRLREIDSVSVRGRRRKR